MLFELIQSVAILLTALAVYTGRKRK